MNEIDTEKIKKLTNELLAYENFERMELMKKNKLKKVTFTFLAMFIVIASSITVDAATDGKISDAIKEIFTIKVDGTEKNANCEKLENGNYKCTLDEELTNGNEATIEFNGDLKNKPQIEVNNTETGQEMSITIEGE